MQMSAREEDHASSMSKKAVSQHTSCQVGSDPSRKGTILKATTWPSSWVLLSTCIYEHHVNSAALCWSSHFFDIHSVEQCQLKHSYGTAGPRAACWLQKTYLGSVNWTEEIWLPGTTARAAWVIMLCLQRIALWLSSGVHFGPAGHSTGMVVLSL